jgi:hypothetical protein
VCVAHGGAAPQVVAKARERIAELRDEAGELFLKQLKAEEVSPAVAMATVRDYTKTLAEMQQNEAAAGSGSVVDDWLAGLKVAE